jgi:hypothetical protein
MMPDGFTFAPAVRENVKLMIGLGGPSGSGKTFSALRLARGLAQGRPIFYIDTEARRALHYADQFQFQHLEFKAPFSPERYEQAIRAAVEHKPGVIIVDSTSHVHEGPGGILEMHEAELQRMAGDDWKRREAVKFAAWIRPKAGSNRLVNYILQESVHFIFCFRAKEKLELVKNDRGKTEPVSAGWTPICADRFEFEMTAMLVLPPGARGVPDLEARSTKLQEQHRGIIKPGQPLSEDVGIALAAWAKGGKTGLPEASEDRDPVRIALEEAAARGTVALRDYWQGLKPAEQRRLAPVKDTLKATAEAADAQEIEDLKQRQTNSSDDFPGDRPSKAA